MKYFILILLSAFTLASCESVLFEDDPAADNPVENFDALWKEIDEGYSFFEFKTINWDSVYNVYRPKVKANTNLIELYDIMSDMLYTLRDGHVNLDAGFNRSRNWQWFLDYPPNFDDEILLRNYWKDEQWYTGALINVDMGEVGYIRYPSFSARISGSEIDFVLARFEKRKGLFWICAITVAVLVIFHYCWLPDFASQKTLAYNFVVKNGPERDDFTEPIGVFVEPEGRYQFTKPVIILTNRMCYSATNFFVAIMQNFPQVKVIGDWTGGGGGTPASGELPNGWIVRYSSTQSFTPDGFNIEVGIPPDIKVDLTEADRARGKDTILERALAELK